MGENETRRRGRVLSPETKWEIFLQVTSREMTQADAARKWQVDVSTVIGIRHTVKDAALAALVARRGRPAKERNWELEAAATGQTTTAAQAEPGRAPVPLSFGIAARTASRGSRGPVRRSGGDR